MLRFTGAGVVSHPTTLQLRLRTEFQGRLPAGAPLPTRSLSEEEVKNNLHYFAVEMQGPRSRGVNQVVLSGWRDGHRYAYASRIATEHKLKQVWHLPLKAVSWSASADDSISKVFFVRTAEEAHFLPEQCTAVVPLQQEVLANLSSILSGPAHRWILAWPLPTGSVVAPHASEVVKALFRCRAVLRNLRFSIKGLPLCVLHELVGELPALRDNLFRTRNRWYVDAEHQREEALLFFPDVLRFTRPDSCRFCGVNLRCDGVPEAWADLGLAGPLTPLAPVWVDGSI